jgi:hypothetical protein
MDMHLLKRACSIAAAAALLPAGGCSLVVPFDYEVRPGKLDAGRDAAMADAGVDAPSSDAGDSGSLPDGGRDTGGVDAGLDAGPRDAGPMDAGFMCPTPGTRVTFTDDFEPFDDRVWERATLPPDMSWAMAVSPGQQLFVPSGQTDSAYSLQRTLGRYDFRGRDVVVRIARVSPAPEGDIQFVLEADGGHRAIIGVRGDRLLASVTRADAEEVAPMPPMFTPDDYWRIRVGCDRTLTFEHARDGMSWEMLWSTTHPEDFSAASIKLLVYTQRTTTALHELIVDGINE